MTARALTEHCRNQAKYLRGRLSRVLYAAWQDREGKWYTLHGEATELNRAANFASNFLTAMEGSAEDLFGAVSCYSANMAGRPEAAKATRARRVLQRELDRMEAQDDS